MVKRAIQQSASLKLLLLLYSHRATAKQSQAWPPVEKCSGQNQRNSHPHSQESGNRCDSWLQSTFSETCFCFLSQYSNKSLPQPLGPVPSWSLYGGLGEGEEEDPAPYKWPVLQGPGAGFVKEDLSLSCAMFSSVGPGGLLRLPYNAVSLPLLPQCSRCRELQLQLVSLY